MMIAYASFLEHDSITYAEDYNNINNCIKVISICIHPLLEHTLLKKKTIIFTNLELPTTFINTKQLFNKDTYFKITTLLTKNYSKSASNNALHTAKASAYVLLYTLQIYKNNIQIKFYAKLGILMQKAAYNIIKKHQIIKNPLTLDFGLIF